MHRLATAIAVLGLLAAPAVAQTYRASTDQIVQPVGPDSFSVSWGGKSGAPYFWCAAGEYVIEGLGLPTGTRIYRYSAPVRRQGEGILFGFDQARAQSTGLARILGPNYLTAAYARILCQRADR